MNGHIPEPRRNQLVAKLHEAEAAVEIALAAVEREKQAAFEDGEAADRCGDNVVRRLGFVNPRTDVEGAKQLALDMNTREIWKRWLVLRENRQEVLNEQLRKAVNELTGWIVELSDPLVEPFWRVPDWQTLALASSSEAAKQSLRAAQRITKKVTRPIPPGTRWDPTLIPHFAGSADWMP